MSEVLSKFFGPDTPFPTAQDLYKVLAFFRKQGVSVKITSDWRENREIAKIQAKAIIRALASDPFIAWLPAPDELERLISDTIITTNIQAKQDIEAALDALRQHAMTDDEVAKLLD